MRILVCFTCKEYVLVYPNVPSSLQLEKSFKAHHHEHPLQIANSDEIDSTYNCIIPEKKEREI